MFSFPPLFAALILSGIGVLRAPRAPSPGLLPGTLTLCVCGAVMGLGMDTTLLLEAVATTNSDKASMLQSGVDALWVTGAKVALGVVGVLALQGISIARTRRAGLPALRPAGVLIGVLLSLHVGWTLFTATDFLSAFSQVGVVPTGAMQSAIGMGMVGCLLGFGASAVALVLGFADQRARARAAAT